VFPETRIQKGIAHMARNSTKFVSRKDLKAARTDLKAICRAPSEEAGRAALEEFGEKRRAAYPLIYQSWDSNAGERRGDLQNHVFGLVECGKKIDYAD
jgi:transposase-like protein